jgi:hypothetical protein
MAVSAAMRRSLRLEPCRRCGVDRVAESQRRLKTRANYSLRTYLLLFLYIHYFSYI